MVVLQLRQLELTPGQRIVLRDVGWQQFEEILKELGDHRGSRLAYFKGTLEIVSPFPRHEQTKAAFRQWVKQQLQPL